MNDTTPLDRTSTAPAPTDLMRPREGRIVAGVAAGIARRLGIPAWAVRTAFAVLTVAGGGGIALYLLGWVAIRDEHETRSHVQRWFCAPGVEPHPAGQEPS